MKKPVLLLLIALLGLGAPPAARAWGILAHRAVTQVAVYELPPALQGFYYRRLPTLVKQSSAADERLAGAGADPAAARRHYIFLDHYAEVNPFAKIPKDYEEAAAKFRADSLARYGTLPWAILDAKSQLTAAFKQRDTLEIVRLSALLSQLAADACAPLHTTLDYDGQLSRKEGLHALWEDQLPERFMDKYKLFNHEAEVLKDPSAAVWAALQQSYGFLTAASELEVKTSKAFTPRTKYAYAHRYGRTERRYSDKFADAYEEQVGGMVAYRLREAGPLVASLWLTAWTDAGRPDLSALQAPARLSKAERERLATELKAWKANTLVPDKLLLGLQKDVVAEDADDIQAADADAPAAPADTKPAAPAPAEADKVKVKVKSPAAPTQKVKVKS